MSPQAVQAERDAYDGAIAYLDHQLGLLVDQLARRGVLENTLVIITADHGEQFGEHGLFGHINSLYLPLVHVPFLILFPSRVPAGIHVSQPVSLRDLPATIADLVGLRQNNAFPGRSLERSWRRGPESRPSLAEPALSEITRCEVEQGWYPIAAGDMQSLVVGRLHYIRRGDGREELYDIVSDARETEDLAERDDGRRVLPRLRAALRSMVVRQ